MQNSRHNRHTPGRKNEKDHLEAAQAIVLLPLAWLIALFAVGCDQTTTSTYTLPADPEPADSQPEIGTPAKQQQSADEQPETSGTNTPKSRIVDKTFDDIKFDIEPDAPFERDMLTDEIEDLAGQRIRIRGWMLPTFQRKGIKQFVLVRDNLECCFGPGAALYDCIRVEMVEGASANFSTRSIAVEGTFSIDEFIGPNGAHWAIYHVEGEQVK